MVTKKFVERLFSKIFLMFVFIAALKLRWAHLFMNKNLVNSFYFNTSFLVIPVQTYFGQLFMDVKTIKDQFQ